MRWPQRSKTLTMCKHRHVYDPHGNRYLGTWTRAFGGSGMKSYFKVLIAVSATSVLAGPIDIRLAIA
jgi:hypothetical protein